MHVSVHAHARTGNSQRPEGVEGMETPEARRQRFELIRRAMPRVGALIADQRKVLGDAHVTACQQKGMAGVPGWFYAWEGGVALGTPWPEAMATLLAADPGNEFPGKAVVVFAPKGEAAHGA